MRQAKVVSVNNRAGGSIPESIPEHVRGLIIDSLRQFGLKVECVEALVEGVSGAIKAIVTLRPNDFKIHRAVAKYDTGVGTRERQGAELLSPFLIVPPVLPINHPDLNVNLFIPGPTLNRMVLQKHPQRKRVLHKILRQHLAMWEKTKVDSQQLVDVQGYMRKIEATIQNTLSEEFLVGGTKRQLGDLQDLPIVLRGKQLPPLREILEEMASAISRSSCICLQHGDEGAGNFIFRKNGVSIEEEEDVEEGEIYTVDNEKVGFRIVEEGMVKFYCWFSATASNADYVEIDQRNNCLAIDYHLHLGQHVLEVLRAIKSFLLSSSIVSSSIEYRRETLYACAMMYYLREMQWLLRRRRYHMKSYMLCLALKAGQQMLGIK